MQLQANLQKKAKIMCLKAIKEQSRYCGTYLEISVDVLKSKGTSFVLCYEEHHLYLSYGGEPFF